ncbi:hypothetical protein ACFX14_026514 [Malus domestica]
MELHPGIQPPFPTIDVQNILSPPSCLPVRCTVKNQMPNIKKKQNQDDKKEVFKTPTVGRTTAAVATAAAAITAFLLLVSPSPLVMLLGDFVYAFIPPHFLLSKVVSGDTGSSFGEIKRRARLNSTRLPANPIHELCKFATGRSLEFSEGFWLK